jgi:hypothetical protein
VLQDTTESRTSVVVVQVLDRRGCCLCNGLLADNRCTQATMRLTTGWSRWTRNPSQ